MNTLPETVSRYIAHHRLLHPEALYLVALSGGADSVCLLLVLRALGYRLEAVHCNFKLRGEESDRDESFCADLCERLGVKLHRVHFDTRFYAEFHKVSIEMAARELRYEYFARLANEIKAEAVCVAHHQDDSVETVIMNLIRGTGIQGLLGIQPLNEKIVRPLLCVSRQQIEDWLKEQNQPFVTDSTNLEDDAVRNRVRHHILPQMEQINPAAKRNIARMTELLTPVGEAYRQMLDEDVRRISCPMQRPECVAPSHSVQGVECVAIDELMRTRHPHDTLFHWLRKFNFASAEVEAVWQNVGAETGRMYASTTHELCFDRGKLLVAPKNPSPEREFVFPMEGNYKLEDGIRFTVAIQEMEASATDAVRNAISRDPFTATLDAGQVVFPLKLRHILPGDRFQPFGMKGMKLLSDFLTDRKVPLLLKPRQWLVEDGKGRIVWLVGHRTDNRFRISEDTRRVVTLCFMQEPLSPL